MQSAVVSLSLQTIATGVHAAMTIASRSLSSADGAPLDRLVNEHEAAAFLGYTTRALQNWRGRGGGPTFVKVSDRSVRYRHCDLVDWIKARLRVSTSDPGRDGRTSSEQVAHN